MKRSTYAGIGGLLASIGTAAAIPPDVMQELAMLLGLKISTNLAAWLGSVIAVGIAWGSAHFAPNQPAQPLPVHPGEK